VGGDTGDQLTMKNIRKLLGVGWRGSSARHDKGGIIYYTIILYILYTVVIYYYDKE
jgi:hypothetical protein